MRGLPQGQEFSTRYRNFVIWLNNLSKFIVFVQSPDDKESTCDIINIINSPTLVLTMTHQLSFFDNELNGSNNKFNNKFLLVAELSYLDSFIHSKMKLQ